MIKEATVVKVSENQYQKQINGINHLVVELKYAVFPETSGELIIPTLRFNAVIPDNRDPYSSSFFSRGGKRLFLNSDEKKIAINPKPATYGAGEWLPTTAVSLSERWSRPLSELTVGEPITRTILFSAQGLTAAQLPPLEINAGDGIKIYPDQPQLDNDVNQDGVMGTRLESVAMVASSDGNINIPDITVKWWDTTNNQVRETVLEGKTLSIQPAENTAVETDLKADRSESILPINAANEAHSLLTILLIIGNLILLGLILVLLILLRLAKKETSITNKQVLNTIEPKEAELFRQLKRQIDQSDLSAFRETLLDWARAFWQHPLLTLDELAVKANVPVLTNELKLLDQVLYHPSTSDSVKTKLIFEELQIVRGQRKTENTDKKNHLQPLYNSN